MKRLLLILAALMLLLTPVLASADDLYPPAWRGDARTLFAHWDTWDDTTGPTIDADSFSGFDKNGTPVSVPPFQKPFIDLKTGFGIYQEDPSGRLWFNTTDIEFPTLIIKSLNFDENNPLKTIQLQLTYASNRQLKSVDAVGFPAGTVASSFTNTFNSNNGTIFSLVNIEMRPNPFVEEISLTFQGDCYLMMDQIVFDSQCVPTPIPGSVLLMGTGILGLVGVGIRRKL